MWVVALLAFLLLGVLPALLQVWASLVTGVVQQVGPQLPAPTQPPTVAVWCPVSGVPPVSVCLAVPDRELHR